jgi:hypothetical protein
MSHVVTSLSYFLIDALFVAETFFVYIIAVVSSKKKRELMVLYIILVFGLTEYVDYCEMHF